MKQATDGLSADQLRRRARRTESIKVRLTPALKEQIQDAAERLGLNVSELIVQVVEHALPRLQGERG